MRTLLLLNVFAPDEVAARIRQAREEAGLTQDDLADAIGIGMRQIQNLESAASKPFKHIVKISEATGHSVEWLLHGEPEATSDRLDQALEQLSALQVQVASVLALVQQLQGTPASRRAKR